MYRGEGGRAKTPNDEDLSRQEQVHLSRLRSGHHPKLRYWRAKIEEETELECRICGIGPETSIHVMTDCPGMKDTYPEDWKPHDLVKRPKQAIKIFEAFIMKLETLYPPTQTEALTDDST